MLLPAAEKLEKSRLSAQIWPFGTGTSRRFGRPIAGGLAGLPKRRRVKGPVDTSAKEPEVTQWKRVLRDRLCDYDGASSDKALASWRELTDHLSKLGHGETAIEALRS